MPLRYYLYVIYSAVFLYKARSTGIMGASDRSAVRDLIPKTMENLQRSSACPNDVGDRYAKLIRLLWSRRPARGSIAMPADVSRANAAAAAAAAAASAAEQAPAPPHHPTTTTQFPNPMEAAPPSINTFSWLDLGAVGDFAIENTGSLTGSMMDNLDRFDDSSADGFSQSQFETTYNLPGPTYANMSEWSPAGGIIF